ncbi:MAG: hypothetical protein V7K77_09365 [Nostoc sp.]
MNLIILKMTGCNSYHFLDVMLGLDLAMSTTGYEARTRVRLRQEKTRYHFSKRRTRVRYRRR